MPYSNAIPVTPGGLKAIASYMGNPDHEHHLEYEVTKLKLFGSSALEEVLATILESHQANKTHEGVMRSGRPPKNAAFWYLVRVSDHSWLSTEEERAIENATLDEAGNGKALIGIMNWHRNKLSGASDMNLLAAAFSPDGERLRDRDRHPIKNLRHRIDGVVEELNILRREKGIAPIQTMQEVQRQRRKERKKMELAEELARMPRPPRKAVDLEPALLSLGCEVTRFHLGKNSISLKKPKAKKAIKLSVTGLLADVFQEIRTLRMETIKEPEKRQEKEVQVMDDLSAIADTLPIISSPISLPKKTKKKMKQHPSMQ